MRGLQGKVAVITGAGSGIGRAAAIRLAEEGCKLGLLDINFESCAETAKMITDAGGAALAAEVDVTNEGDIDRAVASVVAKFGRLDVLVANAGIPSNRDADVVSLPNEVWHQLVAVNMTGVFLTCKVGIAAMRATSGEGAVVLTGSPTGIVGCWPAHAAYGATKAGVHGLARVMAIDYGSEGIRVNVVIPGETLTGGFNREASEDKSVYDRRALATPLKRLGRPEDIAAAIAFLASEDSSFMTGSFLYVDGGMTAD